MEPKPLYWIASQHPYVEVGAVIPSGTFLIRKSITGYFHGSYNGRDLGAWPTLQEAKDAIKFMYSRGMI